MFPVKTIKIRNFEVGLQFKEGEFTKVLPAGVHAIFDPWNKIDVEIVSRREPWFTHKQLDLIVKSGQLVDHATVLQLDDDQRALVWVENRFDRILKPGLHVYWNGLKEVKVEMIDASQVRFEHVKLPLIAKSSGAKQALDICDVKRYHVGVLYYNGKYVETLNPGLYAFWLQTSEARITEIDTRESVLDVSGQEIMTSDKVSLRLNLIVAFKVVDAHRAVAAADDYRAALYREAQLAIRAVIGAKTLDELLSDKDALAQQIVSMIRQRSIQLGLEVISTGIRDIILPGDMKELMNRVTEAKKAAEANLIFRREETAAMRSQSNTAKLLADNPTLMRLRELEILEKIASSGNLNVVLGEKGLADRVVNLL